MATTLTPRESSLFKGLVTSALEKLGPERVLRGHVALEHGTKGDWQNCFLALAYGGYGALVRATDLPGVRVHQVLRLTAGEMWAVIEMFDHSRADLQVLVEEWLELNVQPVGTAAV